MKHTSLALCALVMAISGCSGNSLNNPLITPTAETPATETPTTGTGTGTPTTDSAITATTAVTVNEKIALNMKSAKIIPGTGGEPDTLLIAISGLDTTPIAATWQRKPSLDTPGFVAFSVQEDSLDRMFIGLAAVSADGSTTATVAGDGGQFNKVLQGVDYSRTGGYTPPDATTGIAGSGQVSYTGKYAGLLNGGSDDAEVLPPERATSAAEVPHQPARITGDVFMNANFADNIINGVIKNRLAVDLDITSDTTSSLYNNGSGVALEDVVMVKGDSPNGDILANGTFSGKTETRSTRLESGVYAGVIGGENGSSIAGGITLDEGKVLDATGTAISNAIEHGAFVLNKCTAATGGDCVGTK